MTQIEVEMLTVRQVAKRGLLPERTLRRLIIEKKIPVIRSGKVAYINFTRLCEQLKSGEGAIYDT